MLFRLFVLRAGLLTLALSVTPLFSQQNSLPDSPKPSDPANNTPAAVEKRKWSDVVEPGETIPSLSAGDKLLFPIHEELRLVSWFPTFFSSGYQQLVDRDPRYGVDSGAYGQRLGAAAIRDLSMRTFSDGVLPALLHEDPRYYRKADGSFMHRTLLCGLAYRRRPARFRQNQLQHFRSARSRHGFRPYDGVLPRQELQRQSRL
jgi:hypothetical protein